MARRGQKLIPPATGKTQKIHFERPCPTNLTRMPGGAPPPGFHAGASSKIGRDAPPGRPTHSPGPRQSARNHGAPRRCAPTRRYRATCSIGCAFRLEPVKYRARAEKAGWQGAREGASPLRAVTERATPPDGLFCSRPKGCVSFWLGQAGQDRCGYCRRLRALAKPKILSNAAFPNYFTGSYSENRFSLRAPRPLREESLDPGFNSSCTKNEINWHKLKIRKNISCIPAPQTYFCIFVLT